MSQSLRQLFASHRGRDIYKWEHFLEIYDRHCAGFRGEGPAVLEIGSADYGTDPGYYSPAVAAGIAAACGQRWDQATQHYETALRQAHQLPVVIAQPEVRRWYINDYVVETERAASVTADAGAGLLRYELGRVATGPGGYCHSLDFHVFAMPYTGSVEDALAEFQLGPTPLTADAPPLSGAEARGLWEPRMAWRTARGCHACHATSRASSPAGWTRAAGTTVIRAASVGGAQRPP